MVGTTAAAAAWCRRIDPRLSEPPGTARRVIARQTPVLLCGETGAGKRIFRARGARIQPAATSSACELLDETLLPPDMPAASNCRPTAPAVPGRDRRHAATNQVTPLGTEGPTPSTSSSSAPATSTCRNWWPKALPPGPVLPAGPASNSCCRRCWARRPARIIIMGVLPPRRARGIRCHQAERLLLDHPWPGSIRQLRHVRTAARVGRRPRPSNREHLPSLVSPRTFPTPPPGASAAARGATCAGRCEEKLPVKLNPIQANERQVLRTRRTPSLEREQRRQGRSMSATTRSPPSSTSSEVSTPIDAGRGDDFGAPQPARSQFAWCITGSGHFWTNRSRSRSGCHWLDLFLSDAAEVTAIYGLPIERLRPRFARLPAGARQDRERGAVGMLYDDVYPRWSAPGHQQHGRQVRGGHQRHAAHGHVRAGRQLGIGHRVRVRHRAVVVTKSPHDWVTLRPAGWSWTT